MIFKIFQSNQIMTRHTICYIAIYIIDLHYTYYYHLQITHVVIDEAHLVLSWGKQDFGPAYMKLGLMRTFLKDVKILALTATANSSAQKKIIPTLQMLNPLIITESPDRYKNDFDFLLGFSKMHVIQVFQFKIYSMQILLGNSPQIKC